MASDHTCQASTRARIVEVRTRTELYLGSRRGRSLPLESATECRSAAGLRRALRDDVAGARQVVHKPFGEDLRHDLVGVVAALPALETRREGECVGKIGRVGGRGVGPCKAIPASRPSPSPAHQAVCFLSGRPRFARSASQLLEVYARRWGTVSSPAGRSSGLEASSLLTSTTLGPPRRSGCGTGLRAQPDTRSRSAPTGPFSTHYRAIRCASAT